MLHSPLENIVMFYLFFLVFGIKSTVKFFLNLFVQLSAHLLFTILALFPSCEYDDDRFECLRLQCYNNFVTSLLSVV